MKLISSCLVVLIVSSSAFVGAQTSIVPFGSTWKYLDNGTNQGTAWYSTTFDDSKWSSGPAQLGYGDGDEATIVSYGTDSTKKYITTYFQKVISITNPKDFAMFILQIKRDDGAVVYINGTKRFSSNMPATVNSSTLASTVASDDGNTIQSISLANTVFVAGNNTIAVEIHQAKIDDPDISFDLQLLGNKAPIANAGADVFINLPTNSLKVSGSQSSDPDGTILKYTWTKVSGPLGDIISSASSDTTHIKNLYQGTYVYRLTVTDNNGSTSTDLINIQVILNTSKAPNLFVNWSAVTLPVGGLPDGTRFADNRLRSSTAYDSYSRTIVNNKLKIVVDSKVPVDPAISLAQYHYRSEITEWPWHINLAEGTEQWLGWSYIFAKDYIRAVHPISIFQNHAAGTNPSPAFQLELAKPGQLPGALGGEIQVINECSSPTIRKLTKIRPKPGDTVNIICHVVHARGTNGLLEFWINGVQVHSQVGNTIYPAPENWGGNNKWGIYHHTWTDPANTVLDIAAGHTKFELLLGNLRQITRTATDPYYRTDSKAVVDPTQDFKVASVPTIPDTTTTHVVTGLAAANEVEFSASPVPVKRGHDITITSNSEEPFEAIVISSMGQQLKQVTSTETVLINTSDFAVGIYFINFLQAGKRMSKRIIVVE